MSVYINASLLSILISFLSTIYFTPRFRSLAKKYKLEDIPNKRNQHTSPKVRIGGSSIVLGFFIASFISFLYLYQNNIQILNFPLLSIIFLTLIVFFILGLIDDLVTLSPFFRLCCQFIFSTSIWFTGIKIENINLDFALNGNQVIHLSPVLSLFVTVIWISGITNAFNWLDGLDGLASGVTSIICLCFVFISFTTSNYPLGIIFLALFGSNLGFLKYNFYPSRIMMGDGGSYFLGCCLAIFTILLNQTYNFNLLIIALIMLVPLLDMLFVIISRISQGISPFYPDRRHLHHRILSFGFNHKNTVIIIYLINLFIFVNLLFYLSIYNFFICIFLNIVISTIFLNFIKSKRNSLQN